MSGSSTPIRPLPCEAREVSAFMAEKSLVNDVAFKAAVEVDVAAAEVVVELALLELLLPQATSARSATVTVAAPRARLSEWFMLLSPKRLPDRARWSREAPRNLRRWM